MFVNNKNNFYCFVNIYIENWLLEIQNFLLYDIEKVLKFWFKLKSIEVKIYIKIYFCF